jgi:hypothetical protein
MRFYDMKKITLIALLLVVFTACEKADIRPRTRGCMEPTTTEEAKSLSGETPAPTYDETGNPNALGGGGNGSDNPTNPTVDPNSPDPTGGDITDPLRKKDQKDNK